MSNFSNRLKSLRLEKNLSLRQVAHLTDISSSALHAYEHGTRNPKRDTIEALCDLFNVDVDYLLGKSDIKNKTANALGFNSLAEAYKVGVDIDAELNKIFAPELTEGERAWLDLYRKISPELRETYQWVVEKFDELPDGERQMLLAMISAAISKK